MASKSIPARILNIFKALLFWPLSLLFALGTIVRNLLYDKGILKTTTIDGVAVVAIGNATVGGTGKTPMSEYLIRRYLKMGLRVAYLSRGYKRQSSGFVEVNPQTHTAEAVGDEALMVATKFPKARIAVCENRVKGAKALVANGEIDVLILDDAMQHRRIHRNVNLCMIDASRPPWKGSVMPFGRLREPFSWVKKRSDFFIVTRFFQDNRKRRFTKHIDSSKAAFARLKSESLNGFWQNTETLDVHDLNARPMIAFSGLGNNHQFKTHLSDHNAMIVRFFSFSDHHQYSDRNIEMIVKRYRRISRKSDIYELNPIILTTEKDYMRLKDAGLLNTQLKDLPLYYLKVGLDFAGGKDKFDALVDETIQRYATRAQTGKISRDTGLYPETLSGAA